MLWKNLGQNVQLGCDRSHNVRGWSFYLRRQSKNHDVGLQLSIRDVEECKIQGKFKKKETGNIRDHKLQKGNRPHSHVTEQSNDQTSKKTSGSMWSGRINNGNLSTEEASHLLITWSGWSLLGSDCGKTPKYVVQNSGHLAGGQRRPWTV